MSLHWIKIFDTEEAMLNNIALGRTQTINVKGNKICLARTTEGVFAVNDRCPHNGASLSSGYCNDKSEVICPMHRYPFDLKTGRATAGLAMNVETYPIKIENDGVYIGMKTKWWEL